MCCWHFIGLWYDHSCSTIIFSSKNMHIWMPIIVFLYCNWVSVQWCCSFASTLEPLFRWSASLFTFDYPGSSGNCYIPQFSECKTNADETYTLLSCVFVLNCTIDNATREGTVGIQSQFISQCRDRCVSTSPSYCGIPSIYNIYILDSRPYNHLDSVTKLFFDGSNVAIVGCGLSLVLAIGFKFVQHKISEICPNIPKNILPIDSLNTVINLLVVFVNRLQYFNNCFLHKKWEWTD